MKCNAVVQAVAEIRAPPKIGTAAFHFDSVTRVPMTILAMCSRLSLGGKALRSGEVVRLAEMFTHGSRWR